MPIYQYVCEECKKSEDKLVSMKDSDTITFDCGCGGKMKKIFSATSLNFELKGKGWFAKDGRY